MSGRPLVVAGLAALPERAAQLPRVLKSLVPQVDRLLVWCNGDWRSLRRSLREAVALSIRHLPTSKVRFYGISESNIGDVGKTITLSKTFVAAYHVWCDDDLVYAPDHVERLIAGIEKYDRKVVVGWHGARIVEPIVSYYRSRRLYHWRQPQTHDVQVHVLGTGCCAFWSSSIDLNMQMFAEPNMADIWLARAARRQSVPLIVLAHEAEPMTYVRPTPGTTIYERCRDNCERQTELVREYAPWPVLDGVANASPSA